MSKITVVRPNFVKATVVVIVVLLGRIAPYENYSRDIQTIPTSCTGVYNLR